MPPPFIDSFRSLLRSQYSKAAECCDPNTYLSESLVSPHVLTLSHHLREQALAVVDACHALVKCAQWNRSLEGFSPAMLNPGHDSALMSYDFHVDQKNRLRLIEINTNASMALITDLLYRWHGLENSFVEDFGQEIMTTFRNEYELAFAEKCRPFKQVAIVDHKPKEQKLYIEFEMYRELFIQSGLNAQVADPHDLEFRDENLWLDKNKIDLVYNRLTDFYFTEPSTQALWKSLERKVCCITPHPYTYRLLADKERLCELSDPNTLDTLSLSPSQKEAIRSTLIPTHSLGPDTPTDEIWQKRKQFFFKPKRSYGSRAAYRGSSISRPVFSRLFDGQYLAQEYVPASTIQLADPHGADSQDFKYDLRFFVYQNRIQSACARLYQGQVTNSRTPGGGLACIRWN